MAKATLKTPYRLKIEKRNRVIRDEYNELMDRANAMSTQVIDRLVKKYGFSNRSTIYRIIKQK